MDAVKVAKPKAREKRILKAYDYEQLEMTQQKPKPKEKIPKMGQLETGQPKPKGNPKRIIKRPDSEQLELTKSKAKPKEKIPKLKEPKAKGKPKMISK